MKLEQSRNLKDSLCEELLPSELSYTLKKFSFSPSLKEKLQTNKEENKNKASTK